MVDVFFCRYRNVSSTGTKLVDIPDCFRQLQRDKRSNKGSATPRRAVEGEAGIL